MCHNIQTKLNLIGRPTFKCMDLHVGVQCRKYNHCFAQNFFENLLNQSVIRDHPANCLVYNKVICLRGCPEG